jgi:maleate isomerase
MSAIRRIGFLVPSINIALESDLRVLPPDVVGHVQRMPSTARKGSSAIDNSNRIAMMNSQLPAVVPDLPLANLRILAYACTAGSFLSDWETPRDFEDYIAELSGLTVKSTAGSMIEMLREFPRARVSFLSPYAPEVNRQMASVLESAGVNIIQVETDPLFLESGMHIGTEHPDEIVSFVSGVLSPDADLVLLPCSGWRALEAQEEIQNLVGLPVITANQALFWSLLCSLNLDASSFLPSRS